MPVDWSHDEVEAVVADYFAMLTMELRGEPFNKAARNRLVRQMLDSRPRGSVERKHQNISAILIELGYPYIDGYKPLGNYQRLLAEVVADRLSVATTLNATVAATVEGPIPAPPILTDILGIEVPRPHSEEPAPRVSEEPVSSPPPVCRNYLEIEARNRALGRAGEELVLRFEHERLWRSGERRRADRIDHVAQTQGDHLGYDIHSFEADGRDRLIEVKTTRFGALTPFFATRNEVEFSGTRETDYQLYRLFAFGEAPKLFTLPGALRTTCRLKPATFSALPR
ncbi:MAG: protein NO VEIN domain-containing protein [Chthoniobacterales bacterium]